MRIAIVNNNPGFVEVLRSVIACRPEDSVAWTAASGAEAVEKAVRDKPHLILMELTLPSMDGVQATRTIMRQSPCAILIVTDGISKQAAKVFEAMGAGALDAENMPVIDAEGRLHGGQKLLNKIGMLERLIGRGKLNGKEEPGIEEGKAKRIAPMVAIGSSTGGPKALADLVAQLPVKLGAPVVIVQHVDVRFAEGLAEWLSGHTKLKVTVAKADMEPEENAVFLAGTNDHLVMGPDRAFHYMAEPRNNPYRPSVDAFFLSLVDYWQREGVAVLLTGMGSDGARGLLALRRAGWHTIAQDRKTSVVYGMPKAAAELEAAVEILPLEKIADAITRQIRSGSHPIPSDHILGERLR